MAKTDNPLIVQSDKTLLLDVHAPRADECRNALIPFAELERSPEHLHTYRLTPLSLWNAASAGFTSEQAVSVLDDFSRYAVPQAVKAWIYSTAERFGKLRLVPGFFREAEEDGKSIREEYLYLVSTSEAVYKEISVNKTMQKYLVPCECQVNDDSVDLNDKEKQFCFMLNITDRGTVKQELLKIGWPVKDDVPLVDGEPLEFSLREETLSSLPFEIRDYQKNAALSLIGDRGPGTGFGTIVLPCGAGKTIVGMELMSLLQTNTLIVTTNISAVHQWIDELVDKTTLTRDDIAEYTGENKDIKPVTVATYQILTWRPDKVGPYPHFSLFRSRHWGLIIYDE
ncbi:MAG: helicase-associated domain-containing protein, partial [Treponema sp.]|nr:helicase-associated domain-containing protein [Treponema sp.]